MDSRFRGNDRALGSRFRPGRPRPCNKRARALVVSFPRKRESSPRLRGGDKVERIRGDDRRLDLRLPHCIVPAKAGIQPAPTRG